MKDFDITQICEYKYVTIDDLKHSSEEPENNRPAWQRRGQKIKCVMGGAHTISCVLLNPETGHCVRVLKRDFTCVDDVCAYDGDEDIYIFCNYEHMKPFSQRSGIGYYWDDSEELYTEEEINSFEIHAENLQVWRDVKREQEEEEARKQEEEEDRIDAEAVRKWSPILEELPPYYIGKSGAEWCALTDAEKKAQEKTQRRSHAQQQAAFKRNVKAMFNHFFPGVKVSVKNTTHHYFKEGCITWTDGPTVAEVKAVKEFDMFRGAFWVSDYTGDYGYDEKRSDFAGFRKKFGEFSGNKIEYERVISQEQQAKMNDFIISIFPEYGKVTGSWDVVETTDEQAQTLINKLFSDEKYRNERGDVLRKFSPSYAMRKVYKDTILEFFVDHYRMEKPAEQAKNSEKTTKIAEAGERLAEREGLALFATAEGVAIVETKPRATYKARKEIRANGGNWNKEAKQWQATEEKDITKLCAWFGLSEAPTMQPEAATEGEEGAQSEESDPQPKQGKIPTRAIETKALRVAELRQTVSQMAAQLSDMMGQLCQISDQLAQPMEDEEEEQPEATEEGTESEENEGSNEQQQERPKTTTEGEKPQAVEVEREKIPSLYAPREMTEFAKMQFTSEELESVKMLFESARMEHDALEDENEHTQSVIALCRALLTYSCEDVRQAINDYIKELEDLEELNISRGYLTIDDTVRRHEIEREVAKVCCDVYGEELAAILWGEYVVEEVKTA